MRIEADSSAKTDLVGYADYKPVLQRLVQVLKNECENELVSVVLYGSVARGTAMKSSDIDLIIVIEDTVVRKKWKYKFIEIERRIRSEFQGMINKGFSVEFRPVVIHAREIWNIKYLFIDITVEGIILYDKDNCMKTRLDALRKRLRELGSKRIQLPNGSWYWELKPDWKPGEVFDL
jgi:hypothetical protein